MGSCGCFELALGLHRTHSFSYFHRKGYTTTSIHIDAEITNSGDLLLPGQDLGQAPLEFFGDSDYEHWLRIPAANKDQVLLALIQTLYSGNTSLI